MYTHTTTEEADLTTSAKRWLTLTAACLGLVVLGWAVSSTRWFAGSAPIPRFRETDRSPSDSATASFSEGTPPNYRDQKLLFPTWIVDAAIIAMYVLLAAAALAVVVYLVRRFLTTRPSGWDLVEDRAATQPDAEELRRALRAGLSDIDAGGDPRRAVIACWLRLERAAAEAGLARLESETPTDLAERVLSAAQVDDRALRELAEVYQRARYAPHDIDAAEPRVARAALAAVDAQLAHPVREPT